MTLAAIVFGVVGLIFSGGFVQDVYHQLGEAIIHSQSGHLQVSRAGFHATGTRSPDVYKRQRQRNRTLPKNSVASAGWRHAWT